MKRDSQPLAKAGGSSFNIFSGAVKVCWVGTETVNTQTTDAAQKNDFCCIIGSFEDLFHDHWVLKSCLFSCLEKMMKLSFL